MEKESGREEIVRVLKEKTVLKKEVFEKTKLVFQDLKAVIHKVAEELKVEVSKFDESSLNISTVEKGKHEIRLTVAGDTLVFMMHSNVFDFESTHTIHKSSYVKKEKGKAYCGMINVFNFLSDSFKYNRVNDYGYLVGRIFINQDLHYFVEGKKRMGFLFNDFQHSEFNEEAMVAVVEEIIKYCLSFDLLTPPYNDVAHVTVNEVEVASNKMKLRTGKRLGFKFQSDDKIL